MELEIQNEIAGKIEVLEETEHIQCIKEVGYAGYVPCLYFFVKPLLFGSAWDSHPA
jgi:hypothetical protein